MNLSRLEVATDHAGWISNRGVGSSDVPAILGLSPYKGPYDVWMRLQGRGLRDDPDEDMRRGTRWEPLVLAVYAGDTGRLVRKPPAHATWRHPEVRWATASPDALVVDERRSGAVEAKTDRNTERSWGQAGTIHRWDDAAAQRVRIDYALQSYWQAWVCDLAFVDLAVLLPYYELRVYRMERDLELERALVARVSAWYERHVVGREPPPLDGSDAASADLRRRFEGGRGARRASAGERVLAIEYESARLLAKQIGERRKVLGQQLVAVAGDHDVLELGHGTARVRIVRAGGRMDLDEKALLKARPDLRAVLDLYRRPADDTAYPLIQDLELPT